MTIKWVMSASSLTCFGQSTGIMYDSPSRPGQANVQIKVSFFRDSKENKAEGFNILQLIPKVGDRNGRIAFCFPIGVFHRSWRIYGEPFQNDLMWFVSPRINYALMRSDWYDICTGTYFEMIIDRGGKSCPSLGIMAGAGICSRSGAWAFRTECALDMIASIHGAVIWNLGFKLIYNIKPDITVRQKMGYHHNRLFEIFPRLMNIGHEATINSGGTSKPLHSAH